MQLRIATVVLLALGVVAAQTAPPPDPANPAPQLATRPATPGPPGTLTVPAGTKVMLSLVHPISTKSARVGDGVYLKSAFPVTIDDQMAVPPGTYVQGEITEVKRPGHVKGRAELRFRFTTLIFPSGYTVSLPGAVENVPGMESSTMKDKEGTIEANGTKGRDVATAAGTAATGAVLGAAIDGGKGAGIGAAAGGATGLLIALLTRGNDVRLDTGTAVEMTFERSLVIAKDKIGK